MLSSKQSDIFNKINPILTFDVDWAPDYMIDYVSDKLKNLKIKSTWFVTHDSPAIKKLKKNSLIEVGIHPNFSNNSTQGKNVDEILKNLKKIVPNAKSIRTHGLLQSTKILSKFQKFGIENDVSILLENEPYLGIHYSKYFKIKRFPYYWEDDVEMINGIDLNNDQKKFFVQGLKIFDFHPVHIFLNSNSMNNYNELKNNGYPEIEEREAKKYKNKNAGIGTFFENLIQGLTHKNSYTITDISKLFKNHN
jgi:hypothetical protein